MPKEVVAAIIVGGFLGVVIAFGVWRANIALSPQKEPVQTQVAEKSSPPNEESKTASESTTSLTITEPTDGAVVDSSPVTIRGTTSPNSTVSITSAKGETVTTTDEKGNFEGAVEVSEGTNIITVTAFTPDDQTLEKQITIVYSTEIKQ